MGHEDRYCQDCYCSLHEDSYCGDVQVLRRIHTVWMLRKINVVLNLMEDRVVASFNKDRVVVTETLHTFLCIPPSVHWHSSKITI